MLLSSIRCFGDGETTISFLPFFSTLEYSSFETGAKMLMIRSANPSRKGSSNEDATANSQFLISFR